MLLNRYLVGPKRAGNESRTVLILVLDGVKARNEATGDRPYTKGQLVRQTKSMAARKKEEKSRQALGCHSQYVVEEKS